MSQNVSVLQLCRFTIGLVWIYHGLVPKLIHVAPLELMMTSTMGFSTEISLLTTRIAGVSEMAFGCCLIIFYRQRWLIKLNILALLGLLGFVMLNVPVVLLEAFNPLTTNLPVVVLSLILLHQLDVKTPEFKPGE